MKKKHLVIKSHHPSFDYHLELKKGDLLNFERKPSNIPGWIWCTSTDVKSCWVPEAWVELMGMQCRLQRDYSSKELAVNEGDTIQLELVESGWVRIKTYNNEIGWIPESCIK